MTSPFDVLLDTLDALNEQALEITALDHDEEPDAEVRYERTVETCMVYPWIQWTPKEEEERTHDS